MGATYPKGARAEERLALYAERLDAVELGTGAHRLPSAAGVRSWVDTLPAHFRICPVVPRAPGRDLRPSRVTRALEGFLEVNAALGRRAGPVLLQVPASMPADRSLLSGFLDQLVDVPTAVEFRNPAWHTDAVLRFLSRQGAALAVTDDVLGMPRVELTADFTYWRLRRVSSHAEWEAWAERAALFAARGVEVYAFLKHDRQGQAVLRAQTLARRVRQLLGEPAEEHAREAQAGWPGVVHH